MTAPRTARIEYRKVWDGSGLNWWLFLTGDGEGCVCKPSSDASAKFTTEDAARICGEVWVRFGIQPNQQADAHRAALSQPSKRIAA